MTVHIIFANRIIKILGNILKGFGYIFHYLFPNKRFILPKKSPPLINSKRTPLIPKKIWQTNYTDKVTLPIYLNYLFNRLMSLDCEYNFADNDECLSIIQQFGSQDIINAYQKLKDGAAKADFWRLFVLDRFGGVYLDIDAHFVWPLSKIIQPDDTELYLLNKEHYTNYFIASKPDNEILQKSIQIILDNINQNYTKDSVYGLTGPGVLNSAIGEKKVKHRFYRLTCVQGDFTNEYFQYIDKPKGKWTHTKKEDILYKEDEIK